MNTRRIGAFLVATCLTAGCGGSVRSEAAKDTPLPSAPLASTPPPVEAVREVAAEQTLHRFAQLVSAGNVKDAASLLASGLRGLYESQEYMALRNTPRMEILEIIDRTGKWRPDLSAADRAQVVASRVYEVHVRYKVLGLIRSDYIDGAVFPHKATLLKHADGTWLISELATAP